MTKRSVFIFAYYSFRDPVFQSAVLPYFKNFPSKDSYRFILLTFEQKKYQLSSEEKKQIKEELLRDNVIWYNSNWHSGKLKIIKKIFDIAVGLLYSFFLILKYRCRIIYSEAFPGAVIAHYVAKFTSRPHIIHTYEPHTDYMVEGGVWQRNSWEAKWLRKAEKKVGEKAYTLMTATNCFVNKIREESIATPCIRVPSCVDTELFRFYNSSRERIRLKLNLDKSKCVIIYIGKIGGMYWGEEIFEFFHACLEVSDDFHFLFFSPDDLGKIKSYCDHFQLPQHKITLDFLKREEVPHYLSAADFGFVPVKQYPSKRYCSPIKDGEYWACELPIIIPEGVSDDYLFVEQNQIGLVIQSRKEMFTETAKKILQTFYDKSFYENMRKQSREFVVKDRDIKNYQRRYADLFNQIFLRQ